MRYMTIECRCYWWSTHDVAYTTSNKRVLKCKCMLLLSAQCSGNCCLVQAHPAHRRLKAQQPSLYLPHQSSAQLCSRPTLECGALEANARPLNPVMHGTSACVRHSSQRPDHARPAGDRDTMLLAPHPHCAPKVRAPRNCAQSRRLATLCSATCAPPTPVTERAPFGSV